MSEIRESEIMMCVFFFFFFSLFLVFQVNDFYLRSEIACFVCLWKIRESEIRERVRLERVR